MKYPRKNYGLRRVDAEVFQVLRSAKQVGVATIQAKIHILERRERSLTMALRSHRLTSRKRQRLIEAIEAIDLAIQDARGLAAKLH